ncbi:MAG: choice-of-anchor D domain-containing protein [Bacteroidota bacterium]
MGNVNEINVLNNNTSIADGDNTPTILDSTDFGNALIGGDNTHSFKIKNSGAVNLSISNITLAGGDSTSFVKGGINFPATIAPGDSAIFTISFSPLTAGLKATTVKIINDDCDESIYDFTIQGTGECSDSGNNIWLGNTPDWNLATNWSLGTIPIACSNVIINNGVPFMPEVTEATSTCFSLTLNNGATVTVKGTGKLNIIGK